MNEEEYEREEDDFGEDEDENEDEDSYNPKSDPNKRSSKNLDGEETMSVNYESEVRYRADSQAMDSNSEIEDSVVNLKPREPKKEVDKEDDEFVKAFESLLTENIAVRITNSLFVECKLI